MSTTNPPLKEISPAGLITIEGREDILELAKQLDKMVVAGTPIQVTFSRLSGVLRTPSQKSYYFFQLKHYSQQLYHTVRELDEMMRYNYFGDPDYDIDQLSIEEFSNFIAASCSFFDGLTLTPMAG